jgi:hypothetical protein
LGSTGGDGDGKDGDDNGLALKMTAALIEPLGRVYAEHLPVLASFNCHNNPER